MPVNDFNFSDIVKNRYGTVAAQPGERAFAVVEKYALGNKASAGDSGLIVAAIQYKTFHGGPFVQCGH